MPRKKSQSLPLPVGGSLQLILAQLAFRILRWMFSWLLGRLRPITRVLWPVLRGCLVVIALIAGIIVIQQVLAHRARVPAISDSE